MCLLDLEILSAAASPEELLTTSLWRTWTDKIEAQVLSRPVLEIAVEAGLDLPSGEWRILAQHASEFPFSSMSKEKRRALILLVATLVQGNTKYSTHQIVDSPSIEQLMSNVGATRLVSDKTWSAWCRALIACESKDRLIAEIASGLGLPWPFSRRSEPLETYLSLIPDEIQAIPSIGRKKLRTIIICAAQAVRDLDIEIEAPRNVDDKRHNGAGDNLYELPTSHRLTRVLLQELLDRLDESRREIIELRFGLNGQKSLTLAEIAVRCDLTRERIRQIESKALEILRANSRLATELRLSLDDESDSIWSVLAAGEEVIIETPDIELARRLNPTYRLAFTICNLSVSAVLDGIATRVSRGWYRSAVDRFLIDRVIFQLENDAGGPFPAPTEIVAQRIEAALPAVRLVAALSATLTVYKGYVWKGHLGSRGRRCIDLHRILASMRDHVAIDAAELISIHNRMQPHAACSYRDAEIVMARYGHLFMQMGKGAWVAVGGVPLPSINEVDPDDSVPMDQLDREDTSLEIDSNSAAGVIAGILTELGPLRMSEIVDQFRARTDLRATSVGPILLTRGDFLRMAPGLYGLPQHLRDQGICEKTRRVLLTEGACAAFIRAVRAGEPRDKFPLWTSRMEHEWCQWARESANANIYSSLLMVMQPDRWKHVSLDGRERWKRLKQAGSHYEIDDEVAMALPSESVIVRDLLAPIIVASRQGHLGWVTLNRLRGNRQNDSKALAYLGLLIAAGVLHAEDDWRLPHVATDGAEELCDNLLEALSLEGRLRWDSSIGNLLKDRIGTGLSQFQGWLTPEIAEALQGILLIGEEESNSTTESMIRAIVELGIAIASADGAIDERELERVREHAATGVRDPENEGAMLVESFIQEAISNTFDASAVAMQVRKNMPIAERTNLMTHLFMIAAEDGVFHEAEGRLLALLQKDLGIDPDHFETLYRTHAKDPRAVVLVSEELRKRESRENVEDLVSLLML